MGQTWAGAGQKKEEKEKKKRKPILRYLWVVGRDPDPEYIWGWEGGGGKRGERNGGEEGGGGDRKQYSPGWS